MDIDLEKNWPLLSLISRASEPCRVSPCTADAKCMEWSLLFVYIIYIIIHLYTSCHLCTDKSQASTASKWRMLSQLHCHMNLHYTCIYCTHISSYIIYLCLYIYIYVYTVVGTKPLVWWANISRLCIWRIEYSTGTAASQWATIQKIGYPNIHLIPSSKG